MAQPGRKPKPPKLKLIEGNPGRRPIPEAPELPPVTPDEPDWAEVFPDDTLVPESDDETEQIDARLAILINLQGGGQHQARADAHFAWSVIVEALEQMKLIAMADVFVLKDAAVCYARIQEGERAISRQGLTVIDKSHGGIRQSRHPAVTPLNGYRAQLRFYVAELGLSPSSRGRLSLPPGGNDDGDGLLD